VLPQPRLPEFGRVSPNQKQKLLVELWRPCVPAARVSQTIPGQGEFALLQPAGLNPSQFDVCRPRAPAAQVSRRREGFDKPPRNSCLAEFWRPRASAAQVFGERCQTTQTFSLAGSWRRGAGAQEGVEVAVWRQKPRCRTASSKVGKCGGPDWAPHGLAGPDSTAHSWRSSHPQTVAEIVEEGGQSVAHLSQAFVAQSILA